MKTQKYLRAIARVILLAGLSLITFVPLKTFSQNTLLFNRSWTGFNTGKYPDGQSPSVARAADIDNDGDSDVVVAQENFTNGFVVLMNDGKGIYGAPIKYKSQLPSKDIVVADFNNDGWKDVALTNTGFYFEGNTISVYLNKGNGSFGNATNMNVGKCPVGIAAADLDNDGDADLMVANFRSDTGIISILQNKGDGSFNAAIQVPAGLKPCRITTAKLDSDNFIDIVVANGDQKLNILFNNGTKLKRVEMGVLAITTNDIEANVEVADIDNDNDNDILYSGSGSYDGTKGLIALFRNQGTGTFSPFETINLTMWTSGALDMSVADFNGDGWKDIVAASGGYQVLINKGAGNFSSPVLRPAGQSTVSVTTADVDLDNRPDIITCDWYSLQIIVHRNVGKSLFPLAALSGVNTSSAGSLDAADIDGDGDLDLVSSASSVAAVDAKVTVEKNNGNGTFTKGLTYSIRGGGVQAKFRDLNGDNKPDLLFATGIQSPPYDFHTALNNGDGTFGPRQTWSMDACGWSDIDAFDMDNDGDLDVVVTEWLGCQNVPTSARRIFISKNSGSGNFSAPLIEVVNPFPSCLAGGDFNEDGKIDLVTGQSLSVDLHLGAGTGDLQQPLTFPVQQSPYDIIVRDFNKDGHLDIAACTEYDFEGMSVLLGKGNGTFQSAQNYPGAYSPDLRNESGITSGDVDGDGDIDIMVGNWASNDVSMYLNNGNSTFIFKMRYGLYYNTASPIFADFTGDGKGDIVALGGVPPTYIQNTLALIPGTVLSNALAANKDNKASSNVVTNSKITAAVTVLNNPFTSYIDLKFQKSPEGKVVLQLMDVTGSQVAVTELSTVSKSTIRFNLNNQRLTSGTYFLKVKWASGKFATKVFRQ